MPGFGSLALSPEGFSRKSNDTAVPDGQAAQFLFALQSAQTGRCC